MLICLIAIVVLLANTVLGNDCSKIFTVSPGNITRFTSLLSTLSPAGQSPPIYCDYLIRAPSSNYYIELNLTEIHLQNDDDPLASPVASPPSPSQADSKSMSLSLHQQTSETSLQSGEKLGNKNEVLAAGTGPGAGAGAAAPASASCLPNIAVVEVTPDGHEYVQRQLCLRQNNIEMPTVFRSKSHILKIHYSWSPQQTVSFALTFVFHKWPSPCSAGQFTCDDGNCLPDTTLVCNNRADCVDQSDERNCVVHSNPVDKQFTEVIVIVIVVVFTLGVIACVFVHYRLTTRMWRERQPDSSSTEHHHLNPHTAQSTEVAYMPGTPMDHLEQEVALQRERQIRFHAVQTDMELNLPPAIRISKDGEEGYVHSQRLLQLSWTADRRRESICPPPNKTIYQGDSPPPYRSNSLSKVDGHCVSSKRSAGGSGGHLTPSLLANKFSCGGNSSPRMLSHCPGLSAEKRPYGCHGKPATTACPTLAVTAPSCCHHHGCHGSHGSQLPISHLSHTSSSTAAAAHTYGTSQATGGAGTSRICPHPARYTSRNSPLQHQHQHSSSHCGPGLAPPNALHGAKNGADQHGYYGPPPDYSELAPAPPQSQANRTAAMTTASTTATAMATTATTTTGKHSTGQLQSDSHV